MKRYELANLTLWLIAIVVVLLLTRETGRFTQLGPVLAICAIGSTVNLRRAMRVQDH